MTDKDIDLRPTNGQDEAEFATNYYKDSWIFDQYQEDRISLFKSTLFPLDLPEGHVVMFGTHNGTVFQTWLDYWGINRCIGFELYNDQKIPNVVVMDVRGLGNWCSTPIALCWNDIGSWTRTPVARRTSYLWTKKNTVIGGYCLERGDGVAEWALSEDMKKSGFDISQTLLDGAYVLYKKITN